MWEYALGVVQGEEELESRGELERSDRITIEEINKEIAQLPITISRCLAVKGGNNYHS